MHIDGALSVSELLYEFGNIRRERLNKIGRYLTSANSRFSRSVCAFLLLPISTNSVLSCYTASVLNEGMNGLDE